VSTAPRSQPHVIVAADAAAAAQAAARLWVDTVKNALAARGVFHVALAGGSTPREVHRAVTGQADLDFAWHRTHVYWGDERAVPPHDPRSNYKMAEETLLDGVPLMASQVHRMPADAEDLDAAARAYSATLVAALAPQPHAAPILDLIWLGLGTDGHTASLFPGSPALHVRDRWVQAVTDAPTDPPRRLTLTLPVLCAARRVAVIVTGREKADIARTVLEGDYAPDRLPMQAVRPAPGRLIWIMDDAAAEKLTRTARARA
jgi:6-phosphogluconolactonase